MRICIVTKYIPPAKTDGIPRNRWEYAKQFVGLGHEVHIITSGEKHAEEIIDNIFIHRIPVWDEAVYVKHYTSLDIKDDARRLLSYSHLVYERIKKLNNQTTIDIIDAPLWDLEGYVTKLLLPFIPMVCRFETTAMIAREIQTGSTPKKNDRNHLETHFMQIADAYVFDSWSIYRETERLYKIDLSRKPSAMIYHGIELEPFHEIIAEKDASQQPFKVLIVGRMEKRKGTDIVIKDILPAALKEIRDIEFHFIGSDNGEWDGFKDETGLLYTEYIKKHFAANVNKNIFLYGYVEDDYLNSLYQSANAVLALSRYESFGLLYVEAMQKGKPLIVFDTGAVPEIFENEEDALIVPFKTPAKVVDALKKLVEDPALRKKLSSNAKKKLYQRFTAQRMGSECIALFEEIVYKNSSQRVFQVMNALTDKDGVSNITIDYDTLLKEEGIPTQILGTWASPEVEHLQNRIETVTFQNADLVLYHYWNYSDRAEYFNKLTLPKKVFVFHNMTSPHFFEAGEEAYENTTKGFRQLKDLDNFDVYVGFSNYSVQVLQDSISSPIKTFVLPPLIDPSIILNRPHLPELVKKARSKSNFNILFVGRLCANKKQTDLVKFFAHYLEKVNADAHLFIVGGGVDKYIAETKQLISDLKITKNVTLTGKVADEELYSYYRSSDIYLSMSEHEGFGIPLAEAMSFNLPVIAYNCTSIEDTVGNNGCLFDKKDNAIISNLVEKIRKVPDFKQQVIRSQETQLKKFSAASVRNAFTELEVIVHEQYAQRKKVHDNDVFKNQLDIPFNDPGIIKSGNWEFRSDDFISIHGDETTSRLEIEAEFESFDLTLLQHEWGGKVKITVDDDYTKVIDLFSKQWRIETFSANKRFPFKKHHLIIEALHQNNVFSKGFEVLLRNIRIYTDATQAKFGATVSHVKPVKAEPVPTVREKNTLRLQETKKSTDPLFSYSGDWQIRDDHFKYAEGNKGNFACSFELSFSELELVFATHAWSGCIKVEVDGSYSETLNLYDAQHEIKPLKVAKVFAQKTHQVVLTVLPEKDRDSNGYQVFFKEVIANNNLPLQVDEETLARDYTISVNVNTLNRAKNLELLLKALKKQTYPYFEVVVVNGPSTDHTDQVLERYKDNIKIVRCPEANLSMSRNIGIENSAGNYVAYIDDDALPCDEYWLENYVYYLIWKKNAKVGAIGGPVKHRDTENFEYKNGIASDYALQVFDEAQLANQQIDGNKWFYRVPGGNNIMSKEALYQIGGFDERFIYYLDETDVCLQMWRKGFTVENYSVNYIRHYKVVNDFRKSSHDIRWDIISRSDTFFSLKNGSNASFTRLFKTIILFRKKHFYKEIHELYKNGQIDKKAFKRYKKALWNGFYEGIRWGLSQKKVMNYLHKKNSDLKPFNLASSLTI